MEVVSFGNVIIGPCRFLHSWKDHTGVGGLRLFLGPDIPIPIFRVGVMSSFLEPWVLIGSVVDNQIDQNSHSTLFAAMGEFHEVPEIAISRVNPIVVSDIIPIV